MTNFAGWLLRFKMFVAHDFNTTKRTFQKPNILRKRPKVSMVKINATVANESPVVESPLAVQSVVKNNNHSLTQDLTPKNSFINLSLIKKEVPKILLKTEVKESGCIKEVCTDNSSENYLDYRFQKIFAQKVDDMNSVPLAIASSIQAPITSCTVPGIAQTHILSIDSLITSSNQSKCEELNTNTGFCTQQLVKKHEESNKKPLGNRTPSQVTNECPVKKVTEDGVEDHCSKIFHTRKELAEHLSNDHTVDEAPYICEACGRRFFWAMGLRAHVAAQCSRDALPCSWPGCDRVFRQPCRLREHARAHTGDRPYVCTFPSCSWAFRSASKLLRHARQHTGDRRHVCAVCGRAFLRKEHLRDHTMRRHAHHAHHKETSTHTCPAEGCGQSFSNVNTFYSHMKKVHNEDYNDDTTSVAVTLITSEDTKGQILVNSDGNNSEDTTSSIVESECEVEGQCARTHCPWPLRAAPALEQGPPTVQLLDEESPMEQSEGAESNIYTVRSDLFLHGNVLINEDNEFIVSRDYAIGEYAESEGAGEGGGVGLIDAHPTVDLMQEELMYGDAADETSFRVFFLNGEELT
ncbi:hypothetical protein K1T71_001731 [Dendrolimus kikuchii]|uniref:Uncharacterized protein n=1 Tax=Dendrolimus kikuchii TaxID=765133 RepID=A0ACC1DG07_9NEOP|nr:hypothetical protein K1T71_001731 [Dendrolimus kikuchii]